MFEIRQKEIKGSTYHVRRFGAKEGKRHLARLLGVIGPALASGPTSLESLAGAVFARIDADTIDYMCDAFGSVTEIRRPDSKALEKLPAIFDAHFAGNYSEMFAWLAFACEVNFGDFFADGFGAASPSPTPTDASP